MHNMAALYSPGFMELVKFQSATSSGKRWKQMLWSPQIFGVTKGIQKVFIFEL
jgi:hypothetical protein